MSQHRYVNVSAEEDESGGDEDTPAGNRHIDGASIVSPSTTTTINSAIVRNNRASSSSSSSPHTPSHTTSIHSIRILPRDSSGSGSQLTRPLVTQIITSSTTTPPRRRTRSSSKSSGEHSASYQRDGGGGDMDSLTTTLIPTPSSITPEPMLSEVMEDEERRRGRENGDYDGTTTLVTSSSFTSAETPVPYETICNLTKNQYLLLISASLLFGWVGNNIGWIYVSDYFGQKYGFWSDQATAVIFLAIQAPVVLWRMYGSKTITKEMRATVHWRVYAIMGLLDTLYNLLTTMASPYTSGPVQNLIFQLPVPIALVCVKIIWPKTHYTRGQYLGSFIIVVGATLSFLPQLIHPPDAEDAGEQDNRWNALVVYIIGTVFYGVNTVYKSYSLKNAPDIDYWYVSFVENIWAFWLGFALIPMTWIPGVSADTPETTWPHFIDGAKCMFLGTTDLPPSEAQCANVWWISILWIISNVGVNILGLVLVRIGDSVIYNIVNSVQLPITNLCFTSSFIMTAALTTQFSPVMWIALVCVTVGFGVYQFVPLEKKRVEEEEEEGEVDGTEKQGEDDHYNGDDKDEHRVDDELSPNGDEIKLVPTRGAGSDDLHDSYGASINSR